MDTLQQFNDKIRDLEEARKRRVYRDRVRWTWVATGVLLIYYFFFQ